jgi:hypothetical protein
MQTRSLLVIFTTTFAQGEIPWRQYKTILQHPRYYPSFTKEIPGLNWDISPHQPLKFPILTLKMRVLKVGIIFSG